MLLTNLPRVTLRRPQAFERDRNGHRILSHAGQGQHTLAGRIREERRELDEEWTSRACGKRGDQFG